MKKLLTVVGALAVLAILGAFYAKPLLAQVRAALVQDIDNPARHPWYVALHEVSADGLYTSYTVPAGMRVVVEFASQLIVTAETGAMPNGVVQSTLYVPGPSPATILQEHSIVTQLNGFTQGGSQTPMKMYLDPGTTLYAVVSGCVCNFPVIMDTYLSGYYVTLP